MMQESSSISTQRPGVLSTLGPRVLETLRQVGHRRHGRVRRVVLMLTLLLLVNGFDLTFTIMASRTDFFKEANPVAQPLIGCPGGLAAFKLFMVFFAAAVFLTFRRHWLTEVGCWLMTVAYFALAGVWWAFYFRHA